MSKINMSSEDFSTNNPCLVLYAIPIEDYEDTSDEDDLIYRCFYKEYPDMDINIFAKKYESFCTTTNIDSLESKYSTLDITGCDTMYGWTMPDEGQYTINQLENLFEEITVLFEKTL